MQDELREAAEDVLEESEGTLFDRERKTFETLADRSEDLIVRHVVREVLAELKPYLARSVACPLSPNPLTPCPHPPNLPDTDSSCLTRRWDFPAPSPGPDDGDLTLTSVLSAPLSLLTSLLHTLVDAFPASLATTLYRRVSVSLSTTLYERLLINRPWSEAGAHQLNYDIEHGFLQARREAGVRRGVGKGWELLVGAGIVMALPAHTGEQGTGQGMGQGQVGFAKVMRMAWDDAVPEGEGTEWSRVMDGLGVGEVVGKVEVQQIMRRRPECWR